MRIKENLQAVIDEWMSIELVPDSKKFEIQESPIKLDEYMIVFKIEANVMIDGTANPIRERKRFYTFAQNDPRGDSNGDVYHLKNVLINFDALFMEAIDRLISG